MAAKKEETRVDGDVRIPRMNKKVLEVTIIGTSPLKSNAFPEDQIQKMEEKNTAVVRTKAPRVPVDPQKEFLKSLRPLPGVELKVERSRGGKGYLGGERIAVGACGVPVLAFKKAMVRAAGSDVVDLAMTNAKQAFHILEPDDGSGLVCIDDAKTGKPAHAFFQRSTVINKVTRAAAINYCGQYRNWQCTLRVEFDADAISPAEVANLLQRAGFGVGIGGHRVENGGSCGRFEVKTT